MQNKNQNFLKEIMRLKKLDLIQKIQNTQRVRFSKNQNFRDSENLHFQTLFKNEDEKVKLIAEIKFASPTNPNIGSSEDLLKRAKEYEKAGADAVSIITEKHFFKGDISFISKVKQHVSLPILQKDFIIDPVQIYEAKEAGADALLLIARLVDVKKLQKFVILCFSIGIEPIVEINNEEDLEKAKISGTNIIAVNARNLETFVIDISNACLLTKKIPDSFIKLGFSGIQSVHEVSEYKNAGAKGVLVGTSLMQAKDIKKFIDDLHL